eukprot:scaffold268_cov140-Skeletonema_menzelii.AAC.16
MPKAVPKEVQKEPNAVPKSSPAKAAFAAVQQNASKRTKTTRKTSPKTASDTDNKSSRKKKKCIINECTNMSIREGVCWRHGAKELILGKQSNSGAQKKGNGQQANIGTHQGGDTKTTKTILIPASQANEILGIFVEFNAQEYKGALVTGINMAVCRFSDQIGVGDRIVSNNGMLVKSIQDLKPITGVGPRRFEVVKAASPAANVLSQLPVLTSLMKDQVINQVATFMVQRNISISSWSLDQAQFFTTATRDFPFLTSVAWEVECKKVRDNNIHAAAQNSQMNQQAAAPAQNNPSLEEGFEQWVKLHSEKTKPSYDFSKGGKERREQYKKARKEQRDADNAAETLKAIANGEDPSPPKPKRKKVAAVVDNPYERKFIRTTAKGRRSSVSRRAVTEGVGAVEEGGASAKDNGELADNGEDNNTSTPASDSTTKRAVEEEDPAEAGDDTSMTESPKKYQIRSDDEDDNDEEDDEDDGAGDDSSDEWKPSSTSSTKKYHKITFEERLKLCHAFKVEHGHLNILAAKNDYGLASWAKIIRRNYRVFLSGGAGVQPARLRTYGHELEILEEMGFDFGSPDNDEGEESNDNEAAEGSSSTNLNNKRTKMIWEYRIEQCRQFKAANNGQMNIPDHDKVLGMFASRMRSLYKDRLNGTRDLSDIEKEKVCILEGLGFCFDGNFDANLDKFREYKQRTGKSKVPSIFKPGEGIDKELVGWARTVRYDNNRMNRGEKSQYLTSDRLRKLVRVGFDFGEPPKKEAPWEEMFESLCIYRSEHGKDPPTSHEKLGYWVTKQRAAYLRKTEGHTKHNMSDEREEKLRSIGFVFRAGRRPTEADKDRLRAGKQKSFDDKLAEFIAWKETHGHPYVPRDGGEDHHLGKWVVRMRQAYKNYTGITEKKQYGTLTAEQALKLTQAGFAFDASHRWTKSTVKKAGNDQESEEQNEPEWHNYEHHADPFV